MGHKPGQVSHQEWCHSWEPAAADLGDMSIVRFTPTELHTYMVTYVHALYLLHGVWLCGVQVHVVNHSVFTKVHVYTIKLSAICHVVKCMHIFI